MEKGYRSGLWQNFRREVIELDNRECRRCGRREPEVVLQVHHKLYIPGRAPWQYDYRDCETLCKGCHAAEHGKIPPKTGWQYLGYEDLGEVAANCELCGSNFRYQFFVYHRHWGSMQVGSLCCNALTGNETATSVIDRQIKYDDRRKRFIRSKRWMKISGREIIRQKGIRIEIASNGENYTIQLNQYPGKRTFESFDNAKSHVFDILENGLAKKFIERSDEIHHVRPTRKSIRLKNYDYSQSGLYFVTICSWQKHCIFGKIENLHMRLNSLGRLIDRQWRQLADYYAGIHLHNHIIMPNHLHGVIEILDSTGAMNRAPTVGEIVREFKARCSRENNNLAGMDAMKLWQRNYYEHIIRDENAYLQILQYIENNPSTWQQDGYFVDP